LKSATAKSSCDHAVNKLEPADLDDVAASLCRGARRAWPLPEHGDTAPWLQRNPMLCPLISVLRPALSRLHDFAGEDIELAIVLFAHLGDFKRARLVTAYNRTLRRRRVARRKLDNDAGR